MPDNQIMSFKKHMIEEQLNEAGILKNPLTLFSLLMSYNNKISKNIDNKEVLEAIGKMIFISGQMNFNYLRAIDNKIDRIEKRLEKIK